MPTYKFTSNGKTIKVTGDTPPSESELDDIFKAAGVSTDVGASTTVPEAPSVAQLASAKTPAERIAALKDTPVGGDLQKVLSLARLWATNGPHAVVQGIKDFMGGDYAKGAHEAISGAGITALPMVAGPAVMAAAGAPVTAAATLAGGYAGGKLAPMAAEALGATPDQAALAGDVGMVAGGAAGGRLLQMPARAIAKGALNATAAALDNPVAGVVSPRARNLGEMAGKLADAIKANPAAAEEAGVHLDLSKRVQAGSLTQQQIGERLAAAKAQGMNAPAYEPATNPAEPVRVPLPQQPPKPVVQPPVVRPQATGTSMQPAAMPTPRAAAPVPEGPPEPSMAKPAAEPFNPPRVKSPQQTLNEEAIARRRAAYQASQQPAYTKEVVHITTPEAAKGIKDTGFDVNRWQGLGGDKYGPGVYLADKQSDMGGYWRSQLETKNPTGIVQTESMSGDVTLSRPFVYEYNKYGNGAEVVGRISPREALGAKRPDLLQKYDAIVKDGKSANEALGEVARSSGYDGLVIKHRAGDEIVAFDAKSVKFSEPTAKDYDPAAELARILGTPSDAERRFPPNKSGLPSNPPTARKARGKVSDLADMPQTAPVETQPVNPYDASGAAAELTALRDIKPRPIEKMYGSKGPTPEQRADYDAAMKEWNRKYRAASAKQKSELEKSNEWFHANKGKISDLADMP